MEGYRDHIRSGHVLVLGYEFVNPSRLGARTGREISPYPQPELTPSTSYPLSP